MNEVFSPDKNASSLDYSLQLLFLASQVDIAWNSYRYPYNSETVNPTNPAKRKRTKNNGTTKFKQNVVNVLRVLKHKLSNFCLPCVSGEKNEETASVAGLPNDKIDGNRLTTISQTLDSGIASDEERRSESSDETYSSNWDDWEYEEDQIKSNQLKCDQHRVDDAYQIRNQTRNRNFTTETAAAGRESFRESRVAARNGKMAAAALSQFVTTTQNSLRSVLNEIYYIESRLNDHRWEIIDRESWIEGHLWSSVDRPNGGLTNEINFNSRKSKSPSMTSGSSFNLFDGDFYSWD